MQSLRVNRAAGEDTRSLVRRNFRYATIALTVIATVFGVLVALDAHRVRGMQHARSVARIARDARHATSEQHAALRGFIIAGDSRDREAFSAWAVTSVHALDSLVQLTDDDPAQHERAVRYRAGVLAWAREASAALAAPRDRVTLSRETPLFDRARAAGTALLGREEQLYHRRVEQERASTRLTSALLLVVFAGLITGLRLMRRRMLAQADRLILGSEALEASNATLRQQQEQLEEQNGALRERTDQVLLQAAELEEQATRLEAQGAELEATVDELRASEELFRAVVHSMTDVVFTLDLDQRCTHLFGGADRAPLDPSTWLGSRPEEIFGDEQAPTHRAANEAALRGASRTYAWEASSGDARRYFATTVAPLRGANALIIGVLGTTRDVTEQRSREAILAATQEKYRQVQKLEAIGQLAGGVAHDFNNLLTVVIAYADMLIGTVGRDEGDRASLEEIRYAAERGAGLTRQLLAFSRQQMLHPQLVDLNDVVRRMESMLARTIDASIALHLQLSADAVPVFADFGQLEQILMNLAVNARDAMPAGGTLTISTANHHVAGTHGQDATAASSGWRGVLTVQDDGIGMSEQTLARMAEPFFTTKPVGKGTGLGMSTVHGIVEQSGGQLLVTSEEGHGTTFRIVLPRVDTRGAVLPRITDADLPIGAHRKTPQSMQAVPPAGSATAATILLVDDDDAIRSAAAQLLRRAGYTVISAANAVDALRLLERDARRVDLVLSDMVMPSMSGRELAYEVRVRFPHAAIVLMSGYTKDSVLEDEVLGAETTFLEKPFSAAQLYQTVSAALATMRQRATLASPAAPDDQPSDARRALDAIVNGVDAVVWEASALTGAFHYVSRRAESLVGYPQARWREPGFFESILHADDRTRVVAKRRRAGHDTASFNDEYRVHHAQGEVIWVRDVVQVAADATGQPRQLRGVMIDVTEQKRSEEALVEAGRALERERQFLAVVLENLSEAVIACDADGALTLTNAATRDLHGNDPQLMGAVEWAATFELFHADGETLLTREEVPLLRALHGERVNDAELVMAPKNGTARVLLASGRRFADSSGKVLGAVVAMRDVTEIKRTERELVAAKELAELANRTKSHFLSLISHELRTPLTAVIGFARILHRNKGDRLSAGDLQFVDRITANGSVLLQLVNDLLELTQIETEPLQANHMPIDLAAVVQEVTESFAERASAKSLTLRCDVDPAVGLVPADPVRLRSVLSKLLDNAIKFTPSGAVDISLHTAEENGGVARIEVVDTGIGIAPEHLETIFDPFQQTEDFSRRHHGGSGLGLHLARQQCRTMHCYMSVSSVQGVGSRFTIAFDASRAQRPLTSVLVASEARNR